MDEAGQAHILLAKVFHRSGKAQRRCIKLVFFYNLVEVHLVDDIAPTAAGASSSDVKVEPEVKEDVKAEETEVSE